MNYDISGILRGWDHDPSAVSARWIKGRDGTRKVQLRLDLGVFQMETIGRPDGKHPRGYTSLLDYYRALIKTSPGGPKAMTLEEEACAELQQETMQYYYRYTAYYALKHFEGVIADTDHNLAIIELVSERSDDDDIAWQFLQFYPYVRMMNARAQAEQAVAGKHYEQAIAALQKALDDIQAFWTEHGDGDAGGDIQEVELLNDLLRRVEKEKPRTKADNLHEQMQKAIASENYEKAALLRDELKKLPSRRSAGES